MARSGGAGAGAVAMDSDRQSAEEMKTSEG